MYSFLIRLMILAALWKLGLSVSNLWNPRLLERRSREVLRVDWRPVSVLPDEAKRFR